MSSHESGRENDLRNASGEYNFCTSISAVMLSTVSPQFVTLLAGWGSIWLHLTSTEIAMSDDRTKKGRWDRSRDILIVLVAWEVHQVC